MDQYIFFVIVVVVVAIIILSQVFNKKARIKRKLKKAELKKIGEFKDNEIARIVGKVELVEKPLFAPLSYRECSFYYVHVEQKVSSGKSSRWSTIIEEEVAGRLLIREGDHCALINDDHLKCYIVQDERFSSGFMNDATGNLENYLNSKGYESEGFLGFNKTLRYNEGILEPDEKIAVYGKGIWRDALELDLPENYGRVLEVVAHEGVAVYLSDDPNTTLKSAKKKKKNTKKRYNRHEQGYKR